MDRDIADCFPPLVSTLRPADNFPVFLYAEPGVRSIDAVEKSIDYLACAGRPVDVQSINPPKCRRRKDEWVQIIYVVIVVMGDG